MSEIDTINEFMGFLEMNKLELTHENALEFCELNETINIDKLSRAYLIKGLDSNDSIVRMEFYKTALIINPNSFTAKLAIIDEKKSEYQEYIDAINEEYDRLLANDYLNPIYYKDGKIDFTKYQETYDYIRGVRAVLFSYENIPTIFDAIRLGEQLIELDPNDNMEYKLHLSLYYMVNGDIQDALRLVGESKIVVYGARELIESYSAYKEGYTDKALEYLDDIYQANHFFYRIITREYDDELKKYTGTKENEAAYFYLFFEVIVPDYDEYYKLVEESLKTHLLDDSVTLDEKMLMEAMTVVGQKNYVLNAVMAVCSETTFHECLRSYPKGRLTGILESLEARGILEHDQLTKLGMVYVKHYENVFEYVAKGLKEKIDEALKDGDDIYAKELIKNALKYAPDDQFLRMLDLFNMDEFDFDYCRDIIRNMSAVYNGLEANSFISNIKFREIVLDALDELHDRYFYSASLHDPKFVIECYTKIENLFYKYTYLIQMAQYIEGYEVVPEPVFYKLYRHYKQTGIIDDNLFISTISKLEINDIYSNTDRLPYKYLDEEFYTKYVAKALAIPILELVNDEELEVIEALYKGEKLDINANNVVSISTLERAFWIVYDEDNYYKLADFLKNYLDFIKENK